MVRILFYNNHVFEGGHLQYCWQVVYHRCVFCHYSVQYLVRLLLGKSPVSSPAWTFLPEVYKGTKPDTHRGAQILWCWCRTSQILHYLLASRRFIWIVLSLKDKPDYYGNSLPSASRFWKQHLSPNIFPITGKTVCNQFAHTLLYNCIDCTTLQELLYLADVYYWQDRLDIALERLYSEEAAVTTYVEAHR